PSDRSAALRRSGPISAQPPRTRLPHATGRTAQRAAVQLSGGWQAFHGADRDGLLTQLAGRTASLDRHEPEDPVLLAPARRSRQAEPQPHMIYMLYRACTTSTGGVADTRPKFVAAVGAIRTLPIMRAQLIGYARFQAANGVWLTDH